MSSPAVRSGDFFGEPWSSGICRDGRRQETPVGEQCMLCDVPIEAEDRGVFAWLYLDPEKGPELKPQHRECALRAGVGGIGHLTDHSFWCGNMRDPDDGLSYRESALQVWAFVNEKGNLRFRKERNK